MRLLYQQSTNVYIYVVCMYAHVFGMFVSVFFADLLWDVYVYIYMFICMLLKLNMFDIYTFIHTIRDVYETLAARTLRQLFALRVNLLKLEQVHAQQRSHIATHTHTLILKINQHTSGGSGGVFPQ